MGSNTSNSNKKQVDLTEYLGNPGSLLSMSKGRYRFYNPDNLVVFNANIYVQTVGSDEPAEKIWYGDVDITLSEVALKKAAKHFGVSMYVLYEMDGRFQNELEPKIENYVYWTDGDNTSIGKNLVEFYNRSDDGSTIRAINKPAGTYQPAPEEESMYRELVPVGEDAEAMDEVYLDYSYCFEGINRDVSPLHLFQQIVREYFQLTEEELLSVRIPAEDYRQLQTLTEYWVRGFNPYYDEYDVNKSVSFLMFNYGPMELSDASIWAEPGRVYLKKKGS